jgi:hypothetical protein
LVSEQALGKTGQGPFFPLNFKVAVPKTEVLEQPHWEKVFSLHPKQPIIEVHTGTL